MLYLWIHGVADSFKLLLNSSPSVTDFLVVVNVTLSAIKSNDVYHKRILIWKSCHRSMIVRMYVRRELIFHKDLYSPNDRYKHNRFNCDQCIVYQSRLLSRLD